MRWVSRPGSPCAGACCDDRSLPIDGRSSGSRQVGRGAPPQRSLAELVINPPATTQIVLHSVQPPLGILACAERVWRTLPPPIRTHEGRLKPPRWQCSNLPEPSG